MMPLLTGTSAGHAGLFLAADTSAGDMAVGSTFVNRMGYAEMAGEHYTCIGGDPWYLQAFKYDFDGDGIKHGFDGVVPQVQLNSRIERRETGSEADTPNSGASLVYFSPGASFAHSSLPK